MKNVVIILIFLLTAVTLVAVLNRPLTDEEFISQPGIVPQADPLPDRNVYFPDSVDTNYIGCPH
jgi:hypothetical protein